MQKDKANPREPVRDSDRPGGPDPPAVGYVNVYRADDSERERPLDEARKERDRLSALANCSTDEIWSANDDRRHTLANRSALPEVRLTAADAGVDIKKLAETLEVIWPDDSPCSVNEVPPPRALTGHVGRNEADMVPTPATVEPRCRQVSASPVREAAGAVIGSASVVRHVTDLKQAQAEIERLARFPEENPRPVLRIRGDGMLLYANPASAPILATLGLTPGFPIPELWRARVAETLRTGSPVDRELEVGGRTFSIYLYPVRQAGYVNAYAADITERKRMEDELRESGDKYRQLFELGHEAVFLIDNETGSLLEANAAATEMYGYSHDELLSMRNVDISAEPDDTTQVTRETPLGVTVVPLRYHKRKDGSVFPVEITGRFFKMQGRAVHVAAIRDITQRRQAEETIIQAAFDARRESDRWTLVDAITRAIGGSLDLTRLFELVENELSAVVTCDAVNLVLLNTTVGEEVAEWRRVPAWLGKRIRDNVPAVLKAQEHVSGLVSPVARRAHSTRQAAYEPDTREGAGNEKYAEAGLLSVIKAPLMWQDEVLGTLDLFSLDAGAFSCEDVAVVQQVALHLAIAIKNAEAYEAARREARRRETVDRITRAISSSLELEQIQALVEQELSAVLPCDAISLNVTLEVRDGAVVAWRRDRAWVGERLRGVTLPSLMPQARISDAGSALALQVRKTMRASYVTDTRRSAGNAKFANDGILSAIKAPLVWQGAVWGTLGIYSFDANAFSVDDVAMAEDVALHLAIAYKNAEAYANAQKEAYRRAAVDHIALAIGKTLDLDEVLRVAVKEVREVLPADAVSVIRALALDDRQLPISRMRVAGWTAERVPESTRQHFLPGIMLADRCPAIVAEAYNRRDAILVNEGDSTYSSSMSTEEGMRSLLKAPLVGAGRVLGTINAVSLDSSAFDEGDRRFLSEVAGHLGQAIQNSDAYAAALKDTERREVINHIAREVGATLDLERVFDAVEAGVRQAIPSDVFTLVRAGDRDGRKRIERTRVRAWTSDACPEPVKSYHVREPNTWVEPDYYAALAYARKETVMSSDTTVEAPDSLQAHMGLRSLLKAPLVQGGRALGSITVCSLQPGRFDESDRQLLREIASHASQAIQNADSYAMALKEAERRAAVDRIALATNKSLDLDEILDVMVAQLRGVIPCDAIVFTRAVQGKDSAHSGRRRLRTWVSDRAPEALRRHYEAAESPVEVQSQVTLEAYRTEDAVLLSDVGASLPGVVPATLGVRSLLKAPIIVAGPPYGTLNLYSLDTNAFDEGDRRLVSEVALHLSQAIRNAEAYRAQQQGAVEQTQLNLLSNSLSSSLEVQEIVKYAVEHLGGLLGESKTIALFMLDPSAEAMKLTASRNWPMGQPERHPSVAFDISSLGRVIRDGLPHLFDDLDQLGDERVRATLSGLGMRWLAIVPLRMHANTLGALAICERDAAPLSQHQLGLLVSAGNELALALHNCQTLSELRDANMETIIALSRAIEAFDPYTSGHSESVTSLAMGIAQELGLLAAEVEQLRVAGLLHDVGKIGIPEWVLNKPTRLTQAEYAMIQCHATMSAEIVSGVSSLRHVVPIVRHHHERWDGAGYPDKLLGDAIPLGARILSIADAYDAMTSERPYRQACTSEQAAAILREGAGAQWDPKVVDAFLAFIARGKHVSESA